MSLGPANGAEGLPTIDGNLSVKDALSALIGSGSDRGVVQKDGDGERRLLTIADIEALSEGQRE